MRTILTLLLAVVTFISACAGDYSYSFNNTPISEAIVRICKDHPEVNISFIYKELDNYRTSAKVYTDNPYDALRKTVGFNPVSVIQKDGNYYVEALQHGLYRYTGRAVGSDNEPVAAAIVMLLEPNDSTVITYGSTDNNGRFSIPCDRRGVIGKFSCLGYKTTVRRFDSFAVGTVVMNESAVALGEVKVEADNARLYADRSVYLPTAKQKNASQTGGDLLSHMAIPQLGISSSKIVTNSGKPVAVFIDYIPASDYDLQAMRVADVRKVEFLEYPSDPRLQGNPYVVNFIMQKYEYGGYVKGYNHTNLLHFSEQLLGNVRLQYKKMTYDLMGYGWGHNSSRYGSQLTETYRLPQDDGSVKVFNRYSGTTSSKEKRRQYFAAFKATYNSDKIQASTQINGSINRKPQSDRKGEVIYSTADFPSSEYASTLCNTSEFLSYNGYYFFALPKSNSLTFSPSYMFSHTEQSTSYTESGYAPINNGATDNTNQLKADLKFNHDFGKYGKLLTFVKGSYEYNRTRYTGSAVALDRARSSRVSIAANYDVTLGNVYSHIGFGWDWDRLQFGNMTDRPSSPNFDFSLQYAFQKKHSLSAKFSYGSWLPSPSFKSDKIIESSPLLSYTGNPNLVPAKSYDFDFSYSWVPDNNFSLGAYAWGWFVGDRYVYDYEATSTKVLRTIKQPMGSFAQGMYGINATARFLDRKLVLSGSVGHILNHNGIPYNVNHSYVSWYGRVRYYLDDWTFTFTYVSDNESADGCMNGIWAHGKGDRYVTVGWSNADWNIRMDLINFTRWDWKSSRQEMHSKYYDTFQQFYDGRSHALIQLAATYTFGFGKKVKRGNEPSVSGSASSGILQ